MHATMRLLVVGVVVLLLEDQNSLVECDERIKVRDAFCSPLFLVQARSYRPLESARSDLVDVESLSIDRLDVSQAFGFHRRTEERFWKVRFPRRGEKLLVLPPR